tara:strand:+ start:1911 stop:2108 length:198 start_codon:yes stop_codon:yes gene_type:complete
MGCGCKKRKKALKDNEVNDSVVNTESEANQRKALIMDQKDYQDKVRDALRQLTEIRRKKRDLKNK